MPENINKHFMNRDLSWLQFNQRVLEEAENPDNPLFERLNFIAIYHSNLFEFLRVRVGSLYDSLLLKKDAIDPRSGMTVKEQIDAITDKINKMSHRKNRALLEILKKLEDYGIFYKTGKHFTKYEERFLERYFEQNILPLLSPHIIDKHHPFPFLQNNAVYIAVLLKTKNNNTRLGIIPASGYFQRLLFLPSKYIKFTLIENLIYMFASRVFPKHKVIDKTIFCVTRNADIDADEAFFDHDLSYRDIMEIMVKKRTKLEPIRIDFMRNDSPEIKKILTKHLNMEENQTHYNDLVVKLDFLNDLKDILDEEKYSNLFYRKLRPQPSPEIDRSQQIIPQILKKDILLSYPYEDIQTYVKLLEEASDSPDVISIKITLYRMAQNSRIVDALIRAAENGKEVTAIVELRARFDEANNIDWSKRLQEAGATVIYGIEGYKVHSKLMLITMKSGNSVRFITQIGTGNYNENTARIYTDLSYITSNEEIALSAQDVFKNMGLGSLVEESDVLLVSPLTLKAKIIKLIEEEIQIAKNGAPAKLFFKLNSLNDVEIMEKLIEASDAGVQIDLLIRGICCLKTKPEGKTRNINIHSIVGRYLEHSRIYAFGTGERQKLYIASADFMSRNTERRVEVAVPILDARSKDKIHHIMELMLKDNVNTRRQLSTGEFERITRQKDEPRIDSQLEQFREAYNAAGNIFPYAEKEELTN